MNLLNVTKTETNKYDLEIEVTAEEFEKELNKTYLKEGKKMTVPGFRKGKAPRKLLERYYGENLFFEGAIDSLLQPTVIDAVEKSKLDVVSVGEIKDLDVSKEKGVKFTAPVVVSPEVTVKDYKGIEVSVESSKVTDKDIDDEINRVLERNSRMINITDRPAKNGDIVIIDFDGYVDNKAFEGGKAENYQLTIGSGSFIPGFEEQMVGHNIGDQFDINVKFPEDYNSEELKGKDATFKINLHEIKEKELPKLDDEFAKDVSEFDTLDEYKKSVSENIEKRKEESKKTEIENKLIEKLVQKVEAEVPQEMYDNETNELLDNFRHRLESQGLTVENYMKYTGATADTMRDMFKEQAEQTVKTRLALRKIAENENIEVSDEDVENEYKKWSELYKMDLDKIKGLISKENLISDLKNEKALEFVKDNAVISESEEVKTDSKKDESKE
jgi:trigger factor